MHHWLWWGQKKHWWGGPEKEPPGHQVERVSIKTVLLTARLLHDFRDVRPGCASVGPQTLKKTVWECFLIGETPFIRLLDWFEEWTEQNQISCLILVTRKRWNKNLVWWLLPVLPPCLKLLTLLRFVFSVHLLQQKCEQRNDGGNVGNTTAARDANSIREEETVKLFQPTSLQLCRSSAIDLPSICLVFLPLE